MPAYQLDQFLPDIDPSGSPLRIGNDTTVGHRAVVHGCTVGTASVADRALARDVRSNRRLLPGQMSPNGTTRTSGMSANGKPQYAQTELFAY